MVVAAAEEVDGSRSKLVNWPRGEGFGSISIYIEYIEFLRRLLSPPPESLKNIGSQIHQTRIYQVLRI